MFTLQQTPEVDSSTYIQLDRYVQKLLAIVRDSLKPNTSAQLIKCFIYICLTCQNHYWI